MRQKALLVVAALVAVLLVGAPTAFATNLLTNGSFETGDLSGWTLGGVSGTIVVTGPFSYYSGAEDGSWYVGLGPVGGDGTLSQTFSDTPGTHYTFSFWFASAGDNPSDFSAYWDGTQLLSLTNPNTGVNWTQFSFDVVGTGSDTVQFNFRDDPAWLALDNISVGTGPPPTTPEPSSLLLLGSGLLTVGGVIRRKFRANR
ncbi:MAG: PEP-CTERM sorting domain-containing protein [Terriglobales bacterium]